jgi:cytochrome c-type biogenesis protein CcmF
MITNLGFGALFFTFILSFYGIGAAIYGAKTKSQAWVSSARNAMLLTFPLLTLSALCLIYLLVSGHYEVEYVARVTSDTMPLYLKITALWGGQAGSLLFWSWLMSAFASAVMLRKWDRDQEFLPWVIVVTLVTLAFFLMLALFVENPFRRVWMTPEGLKMALFQPAGAFAARATPQGLNPLLRHFGMVFHPPMLYLGFVSFVIPFAFAIAALVTGRSDDRWIHITRRWTLAAWMFLSVGLILGMRWAYDVLGWGGYWGWDPVEVAALMPWLPGTAFLHSVVIQEKRDMLKHWNMVLVILTYALVIFGTFLTRSGVLSSVHAFAESAIGPLFFAFIGFTFITSLALLLWRWNSLKTEVRMTSLFSREAMFLVNNLLLVAILIVCFWGVAFPIITEASGFIGANIPALASVFDGQKRTVMAPYYERAAGPFFGALLLLMGICPLAAWGHSTYKTLGRAVWKPLVASLLALVGAYVAGARQLLALLAFWLVGFSGAVVAYDFGRAALARHRQTGENLLAALNRLVSKNRRRYGGALIHLSVVLMALGVIGIEMFQTQTQGSIPQGQSLKLGKYEIRYNNLQTFTSRPASKTNTRCGNIVSQANVSFSEGEKTVATLDVLKDGRCVGTIEPSRAVYFESGQTVTTPGLRSTLEDDLYVVLVDWEDISTEGATFKIYRNPLVDWLWLGAILLVVSTLVAGWPERERVP